MNGVYTKCCSALAGGVFTDPCLSDWLTTQTLIWALVCCWDILTLYQQRLWTIPVRGGVKNRLPNVLGYCDSLLFWDAISIAFANTVVVQSLPKCSHNWCCRELLLHLVKKELMKALFKKQKQCPSCRRTETLLWIQVLLILGSQLLQTFQAGR